MEQIGSFVYLNTELDWPGFVTAGLEKDASGRLTLARVPRVTAELAPATATPAAPFDPPAGVAVTPDCACDIYFSDPAAHRLWRFDPCVGHPEPLRCIDGPGSAPGQVRAPRGLAVVGGRLYVADSGNHRVQVIELATGQVVGIWGQPDWYAEPTASAAIGRFDDPSDVAADATGAVYVLERGNARIQKFDARGHVTPAFWSTMAAQPSRPLEPVRIAIAAERLCVLDGSDHPRVVVTDLNGIAISPVAWDVPAAPRPIALAATADAIYVGAIDGSITTFDVSGRRRSVSPGTGQPLAALAVGCGGELLAGPGGVPVTRLRAETGYVTAGYFRVGPFQTLSPALSWHRWRVLADPLSAGSHVQLFTYTSTDPGPPPVGNEPNPFTNAWVGAPRDELDVLVLDADVRTALRAGPPADPGADKDEPPPRTAYFWLGGLLRGDGRTSPVVRQMRIDYRPPTSIRHLPAIYREGARRRLLLDLILAALDGEYGADEQLLALPRLFDPAAAPSTWLSWLAEWLDFDLVESWPEADARRRIADAVRLYAMRGTAAGLRRYLALYAGVDARIEDPGAIASVFTLDDRLALGFNTVLAAAHEQGAVLARTATLGQSHLIAADDIGAPLFQDLAHTFCVQVYGAQLDQPEGRAMVTRVIEREKPAEATYHLCVLEARMRVGFQARLGIDSIVGGPAPDFRLGDPAPLGTDLVLANRPPRSRRIGRGARVGRTL